MRSIEVLDPGPLTSVQDEGRSGSAHLGVPRSGWLDAPAGRLANRLVGNDPGWALLECTLGGVVVRVSTAMTVAVTGARAPVSVDGRPVAWGEPVSVPAGARVRVGPADSGVRSYLAVSGGLDVAPVLGSRSTDTLSGLGPPPVGAGTVLPVGTLASGPGPTDVTRVPAYAGVLRVAAGPRHDWVGGGLDALCGRGWAVSSESNRIGLRLAGEPLSRIVGDELPSEGLVLGAVQVPASGQPVVFLADHPTTGGYPVVAVVEPDELAHCAQLRPGDEVRFTLAGRGAG